MVTSKTLKTCFLLWVFTANSSATSSSLQVVSCQNSQIDNASVSPITIDCQQNPPPDHANEPPLTGSYPNPPSSGDTSPIPRHWHHHHHHHAQKPPTNCDLPPSSGYHNPATPPPADYHNEPPSSAPSGAPSPSVDDNPSPPCSGCPCIHPPISGPVGPVITPSPNEQHNPSLAPPSGCHYCHPPSTTVPPSTAPSTSPSSQTKPHIQQPKTPAITDDNSPSPPSFPNIPFIHGGTCNFWKTHPNLVSGVLRWWHTAVDLAIGRHKHTHGINMNFEEALSNTRTDGIGALYREGATALLNSMVNRNFPFTTLHVRDSFLAALASNKAATAQAEVFRLANEGRLKPKV